MPLHESGEDYLEAILVLHEQKGNVRSIDVAQHLGYSKPSVSRAMSILRDLRLPETARGGRGELTLRTEKVTRRTESRPAAFLLA